MTCHHPLPERGDGEWHRVDLSLQDQASVMARADQHVAEWERQQAHEQAWRALVGVLLSPVHSLLRWVGRWWR